MCVCVCVCVCVYIYIYMCVCVLRNRALTDDAVYCTYMSKGWVTCMCGMWQNYCRLSYVDVYSFQKTLSGVLTNKLVYRYIYSMNGDFQGY